MGTWGTGPFDNDDATAFEEQLIRAGRRAITAALRGSAAKQGRDESWCAAAIAASEVVAAAHGHPARNLGSVAAGVVDWLSEHAFTPSTSQVERAGAIVAAISDSSGLADLWREAGDLAAWRRSLKSLTTRLAKQATSQAATRSPARRPKTASRNVPPPGAAGKAPPIPRRTAKQLLVKKTDGMLYEHRKSSVDVQLGNLKKLTRADAAALSTLPDVRDIEFSRMKLTADKQAVLETLLEGWSNATGLDASGSERVAGVVCAVAHGMPRLTSLDLSASDVTDADLRSLAGHPSLSHLRLSRTRVSEAIFDIVRDLPALERLTLHACPAISIATAAAFAATGPQRVRLGFIPEAAHLGLTKTTPARRKACAARNRSVASLASLEWNVWVDLLEDHVDFGELPDLDRLAFMAKQCLVASVSLGINNSPIRAESAEKLRFILAAWPGIRRLSISMSATLDDTLAPEIKKLRTLELLEIEDASIGDAMAATIGTLDRLRRLALIRTGITKASLRRIASLPNLRWLTLSPSAALPEKEILALRRKLAATCYVECVGSGG